MKDDIEAAIIISIASLIAYIWHVDINICLSYIISSWMTVAIARIFGGKS